MKLLKDIMTNITQLFDLPKLRYVDKFMHNCGKFSYTARSKLSLEIEVLLLHNFKL